MDLARRITIGITTRDRWAELSATVNRLVEIGLGDIPVVLVDDGSAEAKAEQICRPLKSCTVVRTATSLGLVEQRNRLAAMAGTDYLVSLDDDSCFEEPYNLEKAVQYMDANAVVAVLAFWVVETRLEQSRPTTRKDVKPCLPVPVREYTGCGHMLRLQTFGCNQPPATPFCGIVAG